jgi:hypothetical protein
MMPSEEVITLEAVIIKKASTTMTRVKIHLALK